MLQQLLFSSYLTLLILAIVFLGINYYKIKDKYKTNPQIVVFLIPFIVNFTLAKTVFYQINGVLTLLVPCLIIYFIGRKFRNVRIFGLTGGIACGKSTLVQLMKQNLSKLHVIDCDQITTDLRKKGNSGYKLIIKMLGQNVQQFLQIQSRQINRQKFSRFVFQNPKFRKQLTYKMGRLIMWQILKNIFQALFSNFHLIMIDAPILYETKVLQHICYPVIVVGCSQEEQIARLQKRNNYSRQQAQQRIKAQMPLKLKQRKCDIYVKNQGFKQDLLKNTLTKLNKFLQKK